MVAQLNMKCSTNDIFFSIVLVFIGLLYSRCAAVANFGLSHNKAVFCYLATYADHRPGRGIFKLKHVNPSLCTHIVYAFVHLNETDYSIHPLAPWSDLVVDVQDSKNQLSKLKESYPHLKIIIAVGGWEDASSKYSKMAANATGRSRFVNNTFGFLKKHDFDGIDLVWSYPSKRGGSRDDKLNFVELIKDLRQAFDPHNYVITAALDSSKDTIDYGYDVPSLSKYLDYMLIMCYDFHGAGWSRFIGHNAPLYANDLLNVVYAINYLLKLGADPNKLLLGIPLHGRTFLATRPIDTSSKLPGIGAKYKNVSFSGPFTQEDGFLGYNEICLEFKESPADWKIFWDDRAKVPFAVNEEKFITFDDVRSVREKVKFGNRKNMAGVFVWAVDTDDFRGDCEEEVDGYTDYPLLRTINEELSVYTVESDPVLEADDNRVAPVLESASYRTGVNLPIFLAVLSIEFCF